VAGLLKTGSTGLNGGEACPKASGAFKGAEVMEGKFYNGRTTVCCRQTTPRRYNAYAELKDPPRHSAETMLPNRPKQRLSPLPPRFPCPSWGRLGLERRVFGRIWKEYLPQLSKLINRPIELILVTQTFPPPFTTSDLIRLNTSSTHWREAGPVGGCNESERFVYEMSTG